MIQLPVTTSGNTDLDVTVEGVTYTFQYRYNTRNQRIFLNILKDTIPLVNGMRLIEFNLPTFPYANEDLPTGEFYIAQLNEGDGFATLGNLNINQEFSLTHVTEQELDNASTT